MQGFKNLMKASLYTEEALQNFNKRLQEVRKITNGPLDHCESLVAINQSNTNLLQKWQAEYQSCELQQFRKPLFWTSLLQVYKKQTAFQRQLSSQLRNYFGEVSREIKNKSILQLEQSLQLISKVKSYRNREQALLQNHKKFTKLHKTMVSSIQAYKKTFTDVKMIYNKEQKIKRYNACQITYEDLIEEYNQILEKITAISQNKKEVLQAFSKYVELTGSSFKNVGQKLLGFQNKYLQLAYLKETNSVNLFTNSIQKLQKMNLEIEFYYPLTDNESQEYLQAGKQREKHKFIPSIIANFLNIKTTHYLHLGILLVNYQKELSQCIRKRKLYGRQILDYFGYFAKAYQKIITMGKQFIAGFQKRKKKFIELYGITCYFVPAFTNIMSCVESIQQKNVKILNAKYKMIEKLVEDEAKHLDNLQKDFKVYCIEKFVSKKDMKKKSSFDKTNVQAEIEVKKSQIEFLRLQTLQKMGSLKLMFETVYEKIKKNSLQLKQQIDSALFIIEKSAIQIYTCIKSQKQLQRQENQKRKTKENEVDEKAIVRSKIFEESILSGLLNEQINKITFDGDLNKVQEFKKLKKPQEFFDQQQAKLKQKQKTSNPEFKRKDGINEQVNEPVQKPLENSESIVKQVQSQQTVVQKAQNRNKYEAFLLSRIVVLPGQRFIQSYVCGLAYKIILSGRIFITNQRLCFYSKFNPKNIFFGQTFIEIPKKDIKKIEKRQNALVFDNSISITTVNGEMFFTSFFSRNHAYDKILSALQLSLQEFMYQAQQEVQEIAIQQEVIGEQQDDIKQEALQQRAKKIDALMKKVCYRQILQTKFKFKDFTALKYFKLFEVNQEINYNRGKHLGFQGYLKKVMGNTQVSFSEWQPSILQYFNSSNIKAETPLVFKRIIDQVVPVVNSGIPFMPKTSQIQQRVCVYLYSKDKIVFEAEVKSSGVPYCDYFVINYKKEIRTLEKDTIGFGSYYNITFINNTMMKGVIETRSFEESVVTMKKTEDQMNKYIKFLEKATSKTNTTEAKNQKGQQESPIQSIQAESLNIELQECKNQNQALNVQMLDEKKGHLKTKKLLLVSILFNLALLLILMI